ncbi:HEPN domain-containing protein [Candidatus Woesearchaeota archaeon]|nr:HEPN domain-containing protein [Candidatus Woesearchaeota archaeon]
MTNTFLTKLHKKKQLQIVEPNQNLNQAYLEKSDDYLDTAKLCLNNDKLEQSISMSYYSMYYSLQALFFKTGIKCENHSAAIIILDLIYNLDNSKIRYAKKERIDKQYYVDYSIAKEDSEELLEIAEEFNTKTFDFISKMTNKDIEKYRKKLRKEIK